MRASHTPFKSYMAVDGLSDNSVLCGLRDSYGFMWLGTGNGLNCFDGQHNTVYRNMVSADVSFENNLITSLLEQDGDIWFGGSFGLYVYHRETNSFSRFRQRTKYGVVVSSTVQRMGRTPNGLIWICTLGQGLFFYDTQDGTLMQDSRHNAFVTDLVVGADDHVYLTTLDGHLLVYDTAGHFVRQYVVPGYVSDKSRMCIERLGARLFLGCEQGLFSLNAAADAVEPVALPQGVGFVRAMLAYDGRLLLGTEHGLYGYDVSAQTFERLDEPVGPRALSDDLINGLLTDADGTLWVLTEHGGVCYRAASFGSLAVIDLPSASGASARNMVRAFSTAADGQVWIGTDAGLYRYDPSQSASAIAPPLSSMPVGISALLQDGDDLWIGTQTDGIYVVQLSSGQRRHYTYSADRPYTLPSNEVNCFLRTRAGEL
ncbi:MAG: hybrid sensor histidine kinase/response regulator, partial [Bacteroidaceae bacterium]|nr:hybrid sensor histidine kinase/response regulator [Bacteroidaceae bacterium]